MYHLCIFLVYINTYKFIINITTCIIFVIILIYIISYMFIITFRKCIIFVIFLIYTSSYSFIITCNTCIIFVIFLVNTSSYKSIISCFASIIFVIFVSNVPSLLFSLYTPPGSSSVVTLVLSLLSSLCPPGATISPSSAVALVCSYFANVEYVLAYIQGIFLVQSNVLT